MDIITGKIVCWHCRKSGLQLFNVRNEQGKKTQDYICVKCKTLVSTRPSIGNISTVPWIDDKMKDLKKWAKNIAIEGDVVT